MVSDPEGLTPKIIDALFRHPGAGRDPRHIEHMLLQEIGGAAAASRPINRSVDFAGTYVGPGRRHGEAVLRADAEHGFAMTRG